MSVTQSDIGIRFCNNNVFPFCYLGGVALSTLEASRIAASLRCVFFCVPADAIWRLHCGCLGVCLPSCDLSNLKEAPSAITFKAFIETKYMPFVERRKRSFATDERLLKQYVYPRFASVPLDAITTEEVEAWKSAFQEKGYAASSVNRVLAVLKYALQCAVSWAIIERNPATGVPNLLLPAPKERHLSILEARRLMKILKKSSTRESKAIELLLLTGARKSEILGARWEDVSLTEKTLTVPLSKSGRTRYIPLSGAAIDVLQSLRQESDTKGSWLFPQKRNNKPIQSVWKVWSQVRKEANLTDVRLHDLRHSFASFLINNGQTLYVVQKVLGHHNPSVTMRYAHLDNRSMLLPVDNIASVITRRKPPK